MNTTYTPSKKLQWGIIILAIIGLVSIVTGFVTDISRTWSNILLNNYYFTTLSIGALLFYSLQYVTNSGWSALLQRLPLALGSFLPLAAIFMLLMYFGLPHVYEWSIPGITEADKLIAHKSPFLNVPFFMIRMVLYFTLFIGVAFLLRKYAYLEDQKPDIIYHNKSRYYSQVFVFIAAIFFSFASKDWIMTIDSHWYSTLFGLRNMIFSIYYGVAVIILLALFLRLQGYLPEMSDAHCHDLARYLFRFSIVFGYLWFMQFLITWYANIPELTVYYYPRFLGAWQPLFYAEIIINFFIPFVVMMSDNIGKKPVVLTSVSILLLVGLWINIYLQILPGAHGILQFGLIEIGMWLGYAGVFAGIVFLSLSNSLLVPRNHPFIEESIHHHV